MACTCLYQRNSSRTTDLATDVVMAQDLDCLDSMKRAHLRIHPILLVRIRRFTRFDIYEHLW